MALVGGAAAGVLGGVDQGRIQRLRNMIPSKTVAEIKGIIRDLTSKTGVRLGMSGNKPVLINRLNEQLDSWLQASNWNRIRTMIDLVEALRDSKGFMLEMPGSSSTSSTTNGHAANTTHTPTDWDSTARLGAVQLQRSNSNYGMGPVPPNKTLPARPASGYVGQQGTSSAVRAAPVPLRIKFKPSPFWKIESFLCPPLIIPEASLQARKEATLDLKLNPQVASLIKSQSTSYQVRLFCTTKMQADMSEAYGPAPVEFPVTCELRINGSAYSSNLKGSKKSPGRVPPPNLNKDKTLITREGLVNKIQLVYANTNQKYIMVAAMCSYTTVEEIVANLRHTKYKAREEIIGSMKRAAAEEDIEIGTSTLSLRDPLSYTRIQAPCRSIHCSHSQCFDATFFFMSNEQSPTWTCPHCSQLIQTEDLFIDGYFEDIVKRVPEDEDVVDFEQDGSWRTKDGRVSSSADGVAAAPPPTSAGGSAQNGSNVDSPVPIKGEVDHSPSLPPARTASQSRDDSINGHTAEIVLLDDTPSPPPSRPSSAIVAAPAPRAPVANGNGQTAGGASVTETIDLTFSDSEDDDVQPVRSAAPTAAAATPQGGGPVAPQRQVTAAATADPAASRNGPSSGSGPRTFFEPRTTLSVPSPTFAHPRPQVNGQHYNSTSSASSPVVPPAPMYRPAGGSAQLTDFFQPHAGSSTRSAGGSSPTYASGSSPRLFHSVVTDRSASASASTGPASAGANRGYNFWPPRRTNSTSEQTSSGSNGTTRGPAQVGSVVIRPREDDPLESGEPSRRSPNGQPASKRPRRQESAEADGGAATSTPPAQPTGTAIGSGRSVAAGDVSDTEEEGELSSSPPPTRSTRRRGPIVDVDDSIESPMGVGAHVRDDAEEEEEGELPVRPHRSLHRAQPLAGDEEEEDAVATQSGSRQATTGTISQQTRSSDWDDYDELIEDGDDSLYANLPDGA